MAPQYLSPGVYVEEVDKGARPIEGVGTAVAAFVGFAEEGPVNQATLIANWTQFTNVFGGFIPGSYLAHAVYGYFNNGGGSCYVTRLPDGEGGAEAGPPKAQAVGQKMICAPFKAKILEPSGKKLSQHIWIPIVADCV